MKYDSRSLVWKRRLGALLCRVHRTSKRPAPAEARILLYHSVKNDLNSVPVKLFDAQMRYLAERVRVVSLEELLVGPRPSDKGICAITWDDGYANICEEVLPVLRKYNFPATLYITAGLIGDTPRMSDEDPGVYPGLRMLTWSQIEVLQQSNFCIGSHLVHHLDLTKLSAKEASFELQMSKTILEQRTRRKCFDFSYPGGRANLRCTDLVLSAGFRSAVTVEQGVVPINYNPMLVPRTAIGREYTLSDFAVIIRGDWDYLFAFGRTCAGLRFGAS
jgi:peptidoglycan/xylan/chitin deacetylase (PgdA/CDA1 family)